MTLQEANKSLKLCTCMHKPEIKYDYDTLQVICPYCGKKGRFYYGDYYDEAFMFWEGSGRMNPTERAIIRQSQANVCPKANRCANAKKCNQASISPFFDCYESAEMVRRKRRNRLHQSDYYYRKKGR